MISESKNVSIMSLLTTSFIILAISFVLIEGQIKPACASFTPDHVYLFYSTGCIDSDKTKNYDLEMTLITKNNSDGKFVMHEKDGIAQFFDMFYTFDNDWQIATLNNHTLLLMYGNATDYNDDKISIHILGKMINDTAPSPVYLISGKISGKNGDSTFNDVVEILDLKFLNESKYPSPTTKITNNLIMPLSDKSQNKSVSKNKNSEHILLLAKSYDKVYIEYSYSFTAKIFYADKNPSFDFDQHGGEVQNANVTAKIMNWNGDVVKSFSGMTNKFGYFSDSYLIPDDFIPGTYVVTITAEKDGSVDIDDYILNVFKRNLAGAPSQAPPDPDAPTGLIATNKPRGNIGLDWNEPNNPSGTIIGYKIERNSIPDGGWIVVKLDTGKTSTSFNDGGLEHRTQYTYRVSTNFNDHTSAPSNEASVTTP